MNNTRRSKPSSAHHRGGAYRATGANTPRATKRGFIINWGINGLSLEFLTSMLRSAITVVMEGCAARTVLAGSAVFSAVIESL